MNRQYADPNAPWNPRDPVQITPEEFEKQVLEWVRACLEASTAEVEHQAMVKGQGGEYAIDIKIRFTIMGGGILELYLECKHQKRAVERDEVILLEGKLRDTGAHKGMLSSTSGFQKGAIEYATAHGIATVTVMPGNGSTKPRPSAPPFSASMVGPPSIRWYTRRANGKRCQFAHCTS